MRARDRICAIGVLLVLAASVLFFSSTAATASGATVLRPYYSVGVPGGGHVSRPTRIVFGADGRTYLDQLRWRRWGAPVALARGDYDYDSGPAGEPIITTEPALVVASHLARCDGRRTYLKLKARIHHGDGKVTVWHSLPLARSWHRCRPLARNLTGR